MARIALTGGDEATVVLDDVEYHRFTELAGRYGTHQLPASDIVVRAMLYAATGRDVLPDLLPGNPHPDRTHANGRDPHLRGEPHGWFVNGHRDGRAAVCNDRHELSTMDSGYPRQELSAVPARP
jgi:hypothetical protein